MMDAERGTYFNHSPRFVLCGGTSHRHIRINRHTGPKLTRFFLVSFQPCSHHFSLLIPPQSGLLPCAVQVMSKMCSHFMFTLIHMALASVCQHGCLEWYHLAAHEIHAGGLSETCNSVLPLGLQQQNSQVTKTVA